MKLIRPTTITDSAGSFTRSTTATYFDADGVLQTAAINVPRIAYDPVTHAHTGLMIEGAATNLLTYSAQFDNAAWSTKTNLTVTANSVTAPDGTVSADTIIEAAGSGQKYVRTPLTSVAAGTYTLSCYAKAYSGTRYLVLEFDGGGGETRRSFFDVANGTVTSNYNSAVGSITSVGSGWYRCSVTVTMASASSSTWIYISNSSSSISGYTGDGTSGLYVWGAQLETGSVATSYIATTSAQVTRAADVVTGSGLIYTDVPEADYPAWVGGTTYTALTDYVIRTTATTHKVYQCLVTHTTAATPEDNTTGVTPKWLEIGPTNRWGMFDDKVGTSTTTTDSVTVILAPGRFNSLALLQVDASTVTVDLNVEGETVFNASMDLDSGNVVGDWYQYFYEPIYQQDALVITDLVDASLLDIPAYGAGILTVTLKRTGGSVSCGAMVVGLYAYLGRTQYQPTIGITDYSVKATDAWGNVTVDVRKYSKRMTAKVEMDNNTVDNVSRILAQYRNAPLVWVGADNLYTCLIIYGFYKDWNITVDVGSSMLDFQVEGLSQ